MPEVFQYKVRRQKQVIDNPPRIEGMEDEEVLSGWVGDRPASDYEERFARALAEDPTVQDYDFQPSYITMRGMPGEIRVDFVINAGIQIPVFIDGEFTHKSAEQKEWDKVQQAILDTRLRQMGMSPSVRVPGTLLETQAQANETERTVVSGGQLIF